MTECPHCGAALPAVVDAFCPDCREPLDERPASLAALVERGPEVTVKRGLSLPGAVVMALGALCWVGALALYLTGHPCETVVFSVGGGALMLFGTSLKKKVNLPEGG